MPIKPGKNETQDEWMARCVPEMMGDGKRPQDQAVAACMQMWRDKDKEAEMPDIDLVKAREQRSYSVLEVKEVKDDERLLRGVATTPTPDRMGDIVEPLGVKFTNPIPLLWQHDTRQPVGTAKLMKPTKEGIEFEARLVKVTEPGRLKDRIDEAWQSIKHGLVRGVSIGFKALELSFMKDGGVHFLETQVLELSLVTIPANADATIDTIKQFDHPSSVRFLKVLTPPDAEGAARPGARKIDITAAPAARRTPMPEKMTVAEQISAFEAKRAATVARMTELMTKAADTQQTLDDAESQEYDDGEAE